MNLNRVLYFGDFVASPLAILGLALVVLAQRDLSAFGLWLLAFAVGCGAWTLVEYIVHRWVYHNVRFFDEMHDAHHQDPLSMIGAPSFVSIAMIFLVFYAPLFFIDRTVAGGFTGGILLGYLAYTLVHHASHHWKLKPGGLLYRARLRHMAHHFHGVEGNYGVTTAFWDHVFATYIEPRRRRAS
ncbi:sterol desaturase family protein [Labrys wisconsinensis]|uniref:Sterol desaturase/sphingolipid hydroxylase (Fatty acid hydroxylase superfamily) n=1 Tax=Labrys wisconsinensis TaxID=425677 RepID=A0ABU0J3C4_9HYPH|nr:sterol desaturase family protein [Labrys wisconsinensis]MDQ0468762.1 sterol desaturase/sphingolipid hydroxylase (fatty acid hydroxylase superfamily) [Labrys wisconsinensis]